MTAYYNEIDPKAAAWLRELIARGLIAPGDVDERSIADVRPDDLKGYIQCHFFAGIGVWSHALRSAGWADDRPVWTGSCPCQPFSAAGKGDEFADERHLWPTWFRLIRERRPGVIFGEQVASKDALAWLDHVSVDLEGEDYAIGAIDTCAAGFGAPHIRQRLFFVGHAVGAGLQTLNGFPFGDEARSPEPSDTGASSWLAVADGRNASAEGLQRGGQQRQLAEDGRPSVWMANTEDPERRGTADQGDGGRGIAEVGGPSFVGGFWRDAEWVACRDGKWRPHGPESFPLALADGTPGRLGRLRAYGNAIVGPVAAEFIGAYMSLRWNAQFNRQ